MLHSHCKEARLRLAKAADGNLRRSRYNAGVNWETRPLDPRLLALSILIFISFWYWARHVYIPANIAEVRARHLPVGNNSDLYPRWLGTRELLLHGRDPYSPEITREIQVGFYGRPLDPENKSDPKAQEAFVYPLWVALLVAPTVTLPFASAVAIFRWILVGCIAFGAVLWMYILGVRHRPLLTCSVVLLAFSSLPFLVEYYQQNLTAAVVLFVALSAFCIQRRQLILGGFFLALATMKPDTTGLLILCLLIWAAAKWKGRQAMLWSFAATLAGLFAISQRLLPHWIGDFVAGVHEYPSYGTAPNVLQLLSTPVLGTIMSVLLLCLLFVLWFRWKRADAASIQFRWSLAWTCTATVVIIPKIAFYNQLLLIPPLLALATQYRTIQKSSVLFRALAGAPFACLLLQWFMTMVLTLASLLHQNSTISFLTPELPDHIFLAVAPLTLVAVLSVSFFSPLARSLSNSQTVSEAV